MQTTEAREQFAKAMAIRARLASTALVAAIGRVPRERYFPRGPWLVSRTQESPPFWTYDPTPDNDPRRLYFDVAIALDPDEQVNSGLPSVALAFIDALCVEPGQRILQVGCGNGYFTALLAEMVKPHGLVTAVEVRPALASFARRALKPYKHVTVLCTDGAEMDPGPVDGILTHVGVTRPGRRWIDRLNDGGRLLLTVSFDLQYGSTNTLGASYLIRRRGNRYEARFVSQPFITPSATSRTEDESARLRAAFERGDYVEVKSLRVDRHERQIDCWFHEEGWCLTKAPVDDNAGSSDTT